MTEPTLFQNFIGLSRYSRWLPEQKRRETWPEVVDRYLTFLTETVAEKQGLDVSDYTEVLRSAIVNFEVMPSMRAMMMAGPALDRCNVGAYNCAYMPVDSPRAFDECMYVLMCGTGVGFSVERQYVSQLPVVNEHFEDTATTIVVEDTRSGWAKALRELVSLLYSGRVPSWDMSKLRPAGARLKTSGGRSSGPEPLNDLFYFVVRLFKKAAGRRLNSIECHDLMCKIGEVVVVGGVRRSALISLSDLSDDRIREAKTGEWYRDNGQRTLANNSVCYTEKPDVSIFMKEWLSLYQSKSGERGIFNRQAAKKQAAKSGRRDTDHDFGTNPCQPGHATVLTPEGIRTFDDIGVGSIIWSGSKWTRVSNKAFTGIKEVNKYTTNAGSFVGTENHRVVQGNEKIEVGLAEAINIATGPETSSLSHVLTYPQDVIDGWVIGDGSTHKASGNLVYLCLGKDDDVFHSDFPEFVLKNRTKSFKMGWEVKTTVTAEELPKTFERTIPLRFKRGNPTVVRSFLRGLYSANGSVCGNRVTLKAASRILVEEVQEMLSSIGISSYVTTNKKHDVSFENGVYECKESYDLNIRRDIVSFANQIGFIHKHKRFRLWSALRGLSNKHKTSFEIVSVETLGEMPVYDITVDCEEHTYWTGGLLVSNCSEIILRPYQFCNLSEVVVRSNDTYKTLAKKVKLATVIGTLQACLTDFKYLRNIWKRNTEEERLLGVSLTGIMDNLPLLHDVDVLTKLKQVAVSTNAELADRLGIPRSTAITCVKPSGTVSQLVDSASGIHPRWSKWYVRTVRADNKDPMTKLLKDCGVPNESDVNAPTHVTVFSFPCKAPEDAVTRADLTALRHLEVWKFVQDFWCEHKPSITVNIKDTEWPGVQSWVWSNFDDISGVAFLPYDDHVYKQAPYQECTEAVYDELMATFPKIIDWSRLAEFELEDSTVGTQELACTAGVCEVVDLLTGTV